MMNTFFENFLRLPASLSEPPAGMIKRTVQTYSLCGSFSHYGKASRFIIKDVIGLRSIRHSLNMRQKLPSRGMESVKMRRCGQFDKRKESLPKSTPKAG